MKICRENIFLDLREDDRKCVDDVNISEEIQTKKGNLLQLICSVGKEFYMSFDLWINQIIPEHSNVLHLTAGCSHKQYGDRIPYVLLNPANDLIIYFSANGQIMQFFKAAEDLETKKWINVVIRQTFLDDKVN